ncbi:phenylacetate-CoA ligase [Dongia mobilis]|uniref:Phenylacetate-CoA ligase n=1 Tax=Dongia mobilis TaxID=578943 RepID=A0A4R6WSF8_9PROT|nr:phenylacetate--CoA ligase family protein [Dongia mobilis]TDQ84545.1 phenylacetate-CoA ligase [Dongia mobilis]
MQSRDHFLGTPLDALLAPGEASDGFAASRTLLQRVVAEVPAYRTLLAEAAIDPATIGSPADFRLLPLLTKDNYVRRFPLDQLLKGGRANGDFFAVSSGSTGEPTFWPRGAADEYPIAARFEQVFRDAFAAHEKTTLAVVCFALGTWVGGMFTTFCLRALAEKGYRVMIATPGNKPDEILRTVERLAPQFEQTVLLGYPPFLKEVIDAGIARDGFDWAKHDIRLVLAGEVFSETWRDLVAERVGARDILGFAASLYGTADAGVLAQETPLSVAIRRFVSARPDLARDIFGETRMPTLCQYDPTNRYFETVDGTLAFSGDNGVPLIRYHIADRGGIMPCAEMLRRLGEAGFSPEGAGVSHHRRQPFVWVFGRANFTISYFGANIFPETVSLGLEQPEICDFATGKFVMEVKEGIGAKPAFALAVELAHGIAPVPEIADKAADSVLAVLRRLNSEFANYVPVDLQRPVVTLYPQGHPDYFPVGVKHRYSR